MIWTRVAYAGIEIISIPAYAHVATHVQIILYALPVATRCRQITLRSLEHILWTGLKTLQQMLTHAHTQTLWASRSSNPNVIGSLVLFVKDCFDTCTLWMPSWTRRNSGRDELSRRSGKPRLMCILWTAAKKVFLDCTTRPSSARKVANWHTCSNCSDTGNGLYCKSGNFHW